MSRLSCSASAMSHWCFNNGEHMALAEQESRNLKHFCRSASWPSWPKIFLEPGKDNFFDIGGPCQVTRSGHVAVGLRGSSRRCSCPTSRPDSPVLSFCEIAQPESQRNSRFPKISEQRNLSTADTVGNAWQINGGSNESR